MKIILSVLLASALCSLSAAQTLNVSVKGNDVSTGSVINRIEKNSDYVFIFDESRIDKNRMVNVSTDSRDIATVLSEVFAGTGVSWKIQGRQIILTAGEDKPQDAAQVAPSSKKIRITGTITDAFDGEPLIGVGVVAQGKKTEGTFTDLNGLYIIDVTPGTTLEFSCLTYKTTTVVANHESTINVVMQRDDEVLEQATVVGYGTQRKISLIGAQQSVAIKEIKVPVANLSQSLAGRVAGVVSMQRSGEPGYDDATIYIRGISTLTASMSAPLTLVDGVPRSISNVDPEDIESFSILKDASATAIYGVRGANGVIIINTKSGTVGKPKFDIRYTEGLTHFVSLPDFVDAPTYMELTNEASTTRGGIPIYTDQEIDMTRTGADPYLYPNVDWIKVLFKPMGHNRTANANISGGSSNVIYYVGLGYFDESGLYNVDERAHDYNANTSYRRYNVTTNLTLKPFNSTEIKVGIQGYLANANYPAAANTAIFESAFYATPNYIAPKYPTGEIGDRPAGSIQNPYAVLNEMGYANQWRSQICSNIRLTQQVPFVPGLSFTGMFSFDAYNYTSNRFTRTPNAYMAIGRDDDGYLVLQQTYTGSETLAYSNSSQGNRDLYVEGGVNYKRTFGKHDVTGMLLFNQSDDMNTKASSVEQALPYRFRGLAGRFTYSFNDRYFGEFNFGYNGSENFAPEHRYGFFPSFGLGWVMSNEKFFEPLKGVFQFVKFRATWGIVGNANISGRRFAYFDTINSASGYTYGENLNNSFSGLTIGEIGVDVTWETARKLNVGVDIMTLSNNLNVQFDVFKENREGIFIRRGMIPAYTGIRNLPYGNIGVVENRGFETSLDYHNQINNDWYVSALANFSFNRNKVIDNDINYAYPWLDLRGQRVGQRYGLIAEKLFESQEEVETSAYQASNTVPGDIKYKDLNGDGRIDSNDYAPIGWGDTPEIIYGFGFTVQWKNISLAAMFQGTGHVDVLVSGEGVTPFQQGFSRGNIMSNISSRWTEENPSQDVFYPRLTPNSTYNLNYETSSWWVKDAHYLRLKNLQLGYSLPKRWIDRMHLSNAQVFVQGVNVFTLTPFKLWDVEKGDGKGNTYPTTSSWSLGINFSF